MPITIEKIKKPRIQKRPTPTISTSTEEEELRLALLEANVSPVVLKPAKIDWEGCIVLHSIPPCLPNTTTKPNTK